METVEEMVLTYAAAWAETDEEQRRTLLATCWADNGIYTDSTGQAVGREALSYHIESFRQSFPGYRILLTSGIDTRHDRLRFTWTVVSPEGSRVMEGVDFGEVGPDGRLSRITGFFSRPSPLPSSWPADLVLPNEQAEGSAN
ncbi:MAG TPA: nuclear transport factor 2 family protein [Ktedonobacteraceae bacterium]|nr:nuclear transport factor 2 family protein [Ktedonobacteraceae bacterium]